MSARDALTVAPGAAPVRVGAGVADVFYVAADSDAMPVATLEAGAVVVGGAAVATLRVVPRIDAELGAVAADGDGGQGVRAFADAIARRLGGDAADVLSQARPADLPDMLDRVLPGHAELLRLERIDRMQRSAGFDADLLAGAYRRARQDIRLPGHALPPGSADPLVSALRILGGVQGFAVKEPVLFGAGAAPADGPAHLAAIAHASGVRYRPIRLAGDWQRANATPYLALLAGDGDPQPVALLPSARGYQLQRPDGTSPRRLTPELAADLLDFAFEFYAPLPRDRAAMWTDVAALALRRTRAEWTWTLLMGLGVVLLGLLTPILTTFVLGTVVPQGDKRLLLGLGVALACAAFTAAAFSFVQYLAMSRFGQRAVQRVQPAFWDRVLSLPAPFFRRYSAGDLSVRVMSVDALQQLVNVQVVGAILAAVFSLVNVALMFVYDVPLGFVGLLVLLATIGVLAAAMRGIQTLYTRSVDAQLAGTSWVVQLLTGIAKVRLAGAETRMQSRYLDLVREQVVSMSRMTQVIGRVTAWVLLATSLAPALFVLLVGIQLEDTGTTISPSTFLALNTAYLAAFGAVSGLVASLTAIASAAPIFQLLRPLMESLPEAATHRADPGTLDGEIELRNVSFRYGPDAPLVLDRLSLRVRPGEVVALVGPSGSGKTTTIRVLLGFDDPDDGQVLFDGRDLRDLDLDLVRAQMGIVIQNGQITRTTILKNILGGVDADEYAAWEAASAAALADDIQAMPMKMQTHVDPQLVSGGQAQRILLARALVRRPSIVVLDEATSALDNVSQAKVTEALSRLGATRIVVAHRLSTVKAADRVLVLVAGRVVEEGSYDALIAKGGVFADLAKRQLA